MKVGEKSSDTQLLKLNKEIMLPAAVNVRWSCKEKKKKNIAPKKTRWRELFYPSK